MTYPNSPGWKGDVGGVGQEAAADFAPKLAHRQAEAYEALKALGQATALQVAQRIKREWFHTAPRLSDLKAKGLVTATGDRGRSAFGNPATIYRVCTEEEVRQFQREQQRAADGGRA